MRGRMIVLKPRKFQLSAWRDYLQKVHIRELFKHKFTPELHIYYIYNINKDLAHSLYLIWSLSDDPESCQLSLKK